MKQPCFMIVKLDDDIGRALILGGSDTTAGTQDLCTFTSPIKNELVRVLNYLSTRGSSMDHHRISE
ncbi:hypothetical protein JHK85_009216 [Glycine max]|nr:hypothetical protein JHK85_009216 [Glycine max]